MIATKHHTAFELGEIAGSRNQPAWRNPNVAPGQNQALVEWHRGWCAGQQLRAQTKQRTGVLPKAKTL